MSSSHNVTGLDTGAMQLGSNDLLSDKSLGLDQLVARMVGMARLTAASRFPRLLVDRTVPLHALIVSPPAFAARATHPARQSDQARRGHTAAARRLVTAALSRPLARLSVIP